MDNPPAPPEPGGPRDRRLGPLNPFTVAIGAVLLAAGGAFGWSLKGAAPTAHATPRALRQALALERLEPPAVCAPGGDQVLRETVLRGDAPAAGRVADYLPEKSPIPGYEMVRSGPLDPAGDTDYLPGAVEGQVAAFRPPGEGGFDVHAYRFLTRPSAADSLASAVAARACRAGATVYEARGRPGMVVLRDPGPRGWLSAWWVARSDVVVVGYGGWGDGDADLANLAVVAAVTAARR